ncbi:MAG: hypothetical protein OXF76_07685 [Caldilineaceae bacterium]|nr:hypothetical protein [Caldilineaceae bacterium]
MQGIPQAQYQKSPQPSHDLGLFRLLSLDLPAIVSLLFVLGALIPSALVLTLGYLPVGFFNTALGRGDMDRLVFGGGETLLLVSGAGVVIFLAGPTFFWRVHHFRRILRYTTLAPGQITRLNVNILEFRVDYVYRFQQRVFSGHNSIRRNHRRERRVSLRPGQSITALVDSFQPEASIVLELYTNVGNLPSVR